MPRNLLGDGLALNFIGVEQLRAGPAFDHGREHPRQIHRVRDAGVHAIGRERHPDVRCVAAQEDALVTETAGDHASPRPVLLAQRLARKRLRQAEDVAYALLPV